MMYDSDDHKEFDKLSEETKADLIGWINKNLLPRKTVNRWHSSYGLKHIYSSDTCTKGDDHYITNGQFKGAMLAAGFEPHDRNQRNWCFGISERSPRFRRQL